MKNIFAGVFAGLTTVAALTAGVIWLGTKLTEKAIDNFAAGLESQRRMLENRQNLIFKSAIDFKAQQLTEFYWPIYIRLLKDNAIWDRIMDRAGPDQKLSLLAQGIEEKDILPNHTDIVHVIETKIHLAQADDALQAALMQYVRHVAVYKAIRAAKDDRWPAAVGEPWPASLFGLIESRTKSLQKDLDLTLATTTIGSADRPSPAKP